MPVAYNAMPLTRAPQLSATANSLFISRDVMAHRAPSNGGTGRVAGRSRQAR